MRPNFSRPIFRVLLFLELALVLLITVPANTWGAGVSVKEEAPGSVYFRDDFDTLDNWKTLKFKSIENMSTYTVEAMAGSGSCVRAQSSGSASAIAWQGEFEVYKYPMMRWRWKVSNVYSRGDATSKKGDDYPIRINVMFQYDPKDPNVKRKLKYGLGKIFYGKYPPYTSLTYIWANRSQRQKYLPSPYVREDMMIPLRSGPEFAGQWMEEEVNLLEDYRAAFGTDPPRKANLAIMNDSDDMGESSVSWVDWIVIFEK